MHRIGDSEVVICLDAAHGETLWESAYEAKYEGMKRNGTVPRSTPLIVGDRLFTIVGQTMYVRDQGQILALDLG